MTERLPSSSSVSTGDSPYLDAAAAEEEMQTESGEQLETGAVAAVAEEPLPRVVTSRHSACNQPPAGDEMQQSEETDSDLQQSAKADSDQPASVQADQQQHTAAAASGAEKPAQEVSPRDLRIREVRSPRVRAAAGLLQFLIIALVQPKHREGVTKRPREDPAHPCPRCAGSETAEHAPDCPNRDIFFDVLLCPDCGYTALTMSAFRDHALQCFEAIRRPYLQRRQVRRDTAWTRRRHLPTLYFCTRPGCDYRTHIKSYQWAHEILCHLHVLHFTPRSVPYPILPGREQVDREHEDAWHLRPGLMNDLQRIQQFLASPQGTDLLRAWQENNLPEDRSMLPAIPQLRPALRRRLPTDQQKAAHKKKPSGVSSVSVTAATPKRQRDQSTRPRSQSRRRRSPRRRSQSGRRDQHRDGAGKRCRRAASRSRARKGSNSRSRAVRHRRSDTPSPQRGGLHQFPGVGRVLPAGAEGRAPLPMTTAAASTTHSSTSAHGARPRTGAQASGDAQAPSPPVQQMAQLSIRSCPPGTAQYVGVLFSLLMGKATARIRVRGVLMPGVGAVFSRSLNGASCLYADTSMAVADDPTIPATYVIAYLHGNMPPYLPAGRIRFATDIEDDDVLLQFPTGPAQMELEWL